MSSVDIALTQINDQEPVYEFANCVSFHPDKRILYIKSYKIPSGITRVSTNEYVKHGYSTTIYNLVLNPRPALVGGEHILELSEGIRDLKPMEVALKHSFQQALSRAFRRRTNREVDISAM